MSRHRTVTGQLELPKKWKWVPLGEILTNIIGGGTPSKSNPSYWQGKIPWLTIKDMRTRRPIDSIDHISEAAVKESSTNIIPADTVIIATRVGLGKVVRAPYDATINQDLKALIPKAGIDKSYLEYWIVSIADYLESIGSGTTVKGIRLETLREIPFPLAPPEAQKQIVAEIEKQFSRLDEAVASLKRIQANLKRYKAAVLKAAVEGKLTEQWRKGHPDVEPADQLLKRILTERRPKWEESVGAKQGVSASPGFGAVGINNGDCNKGEAGESFASPLPQMKTKGIKPKDDSWKKRYKEPAGPDTNNLPELPEGWVWIRLGALQVDVFDGPFGSNLKSTDYVSNGVRVIRLENIGSREFIDGKESFVTEQKYEQLKKHTVGHGDIIFSSFVANETRVVMLPGHIKKAINKADCFCVRINDEAINKRYIETFLATRTAYEQLVGEVHGATRPRINTTQLKDCHVSMPPLAEQNEIVSELDRRLSVTEELETTIETNLKRAERLRQMILQQAFSGGLV